MPVFGAFIAAVLIWALWTGRIRTQQLPPIILGLAGMIILLRGSFLVGAGALIVAAPWYLGMNRRLFGPKSTQRDQHAIDKARYLLGVSPDDNAEQIRSRHRILIAQYHPDIGGNNVRARELNAARDLLLRDLKSKLD